MTRLDRLCPDWVEATSLITARGRLPQAQRTANERVLPLPNGACAVRLTTLLRCLGIGCRSTFDIGGMRRTFVTHFLSISEADWPVVAARLATCQQQIDRGVRWLDGTSAPHLLARAFWDGTMLVCSRVRTRDGAIVVRLGTAAQADALVASAGVLGLDATRLQRKSGHSIRVQIAL